MELVVLLKQVPDLAEELEIDASGRDLARDWLRAKLKPRDTEEEEVFRHL